MNYVVKLIYQYDEPLDPIHEIKNDYKLPLSYFTLRRMKLYMQKTGLTISI